MSFDKNHTNIKRQESIVPKAAPKVAFQPPQSPPDNEPECDEEMIKKTSSLIKKLILKPKTNESLYSQTFIER